MTYDFITVHGYNIGIGIGPLLAIGTIVAALVIIPYWQLFSKAGYSGWLSFLMVLPLINLIALWVLAFSQWPALRKKPTQIS